MDFTCGHYQEPQNHGMCGTRRVFRNYLILQILSCVEGETEARGKEVAQVTQWLFITGLVLAAGLSGPLS